MKIICSNCSATNLPTASKCHDCEQPLSLHFNSQIQTQQGQVLSLLDLLDKIGMLESRLVTVEQFYEKEHQRQETPKVIEKETAIPKAESKPKEIVPKQLPKDLKALKALLQEVERAKIEAKECADFSLHATLDFEGKKIARKIKLLEEPVVEKTSAPEIQQPKVEQTEQKPTHKVYPTNVKGLKELLVQNLVAQRATQGNSGRLIELKKEEQQIRKRLQNLELAARYGKEKEEDSQEVVKEENQTTVPKVNKRLIFEIEQELSAVWKAKQRATQAQDPVRLAMLSDKERQLKEELQLAESGAIQERLKEETIEKELVKSTPVAVSHQKQSIKKVPIEPQGPTAIEQFFAPITSAVSFVETRYRQYKEEGKLPLFFLTLAGVVTLLFGFGFLAQYSAVTYFGDYLTQLKVGFGFLCSTAVIGIGAKLIAKDAKFEEFGAALMGLGLSLNYLFIYFLSEEPPLVSPTVGFVLIFVNTAISIACSIRYESKIIAVLALFGGGLAPSYLHSTGENTHIYFGYLWILCAASAWTARKLKWEVLNLISFVLSTLILAQSTYFNYTDVRTLETPVYVVLFHCFAYLYAWVSLFEGKNPKSKLVNYNLITLVGGQALLAMSLYYVYGVNEALYNRLGTIYLGNAFVFVALTTVFWKKWSARIQALLIGIASAFVAAAIPAYFGVAYRGLLWALQGIVLLGGGLIFKMPLVRRAAYVIVSGGLVNMLSNLHWDAMPDRATGVLWTSGYINLWSVGVVLIAVSVLFKRYEESLEHHEKKVPILFNELIAVWGIYSFYITAFFFFGDYAYNLAVVPMIVLLLWNNYQKLHLAEILGLGQFIVLVLAVIISVEEVYSWHFLDQLTYGKIAMIEVLLVLWGLDLFYERILPNASKQTQKVASIAREIFYVIFPFFIQDIFLYQFPEYFVHSLWFVAAVMFGLSEMTKSKVAPVVFFALTVMAIIMSFEPIHYGALVLGNVVLGSIFVYKKGWDKEISFSKFNPDLICVVVPYFAIISLALAYFKFSDGDLISALWIAAAGVLTLVNLGQRVRPVSQTTIIAYRVAWGTSILALLLSIQVLANEDMLSKFAVVGWSALGVVLLWSYKMIYKATIVYKGDRSSDLWKIESIVVQALTVLSYIGFLYWLTGDVENIILTIVLFLHGIALVFNALLPDFKHFTKLYAIILGIAIIKLFFNDMKDADTVVKIFAFIIIGAICLLAAFFLIKYNDKNKPKES